MLTGRRYRLQLTPEQAEFAERIGGICRAVWNTGLEQRREYRRRDAWIGYQQQAKELAEAKSEHSWLAEAPSHCLQQTLMDLDKACRRHGTFGVRWRSGRRWRPSFRIPDGGKIQVERLNRRWGRVKLPKFGWVRFRMSRALGGTVRSATVSHDGGHWYISLLVEDGVIQGERHVSTSSVGVDRGVAVAVAASDGRLYDRSFAGKAEGQRYKRLQRKLARQKKGSANRRRTLDMMRSLKRRERNRRADFNAWVANRLTARHGLIAIEMLRVRNMTASARRTITEPGKNVRQKAGLNRSILDKGWYQFELALANAARYTGTQIVKVAAAYTSQTCSRCRTTDPESRESQAVYRCRACGHSENADVNAAKNILAAGLAVTACGDLGAGRSVKQEPQPSQGEIPRPQAWGGRQHPDQCLKCVGTDVEVAGALVYGLDDPIPGQTSADLCNKAIA
ncbi:RNA-guided endonuclease InsQ/TnpB family protein [Nocardia vinacea]|uniref:RNA-guided endonuclease InsQ/TnpB family protein n=1 Tax=Nocardia vinacea TaxID=96468 RepID=UPI0007C54FB3|nr:RNA-guided endonuclease TnpB family protein [Nocardia vinacea]